MLVGIEPDAELQGESALGKSAQRSSQEPGPGRVSTLGDLALVNLALVNLALVGIGGAMGALARYLLTEAIPVSSLAVTLGVNVTGAFLLGALVTALAAQHPRLLLLLGTGLLGGFTTYSLFALQISELGLSGHLGLGALYGVGTVIVGFAATLAGAGCGGAARRLLRGRA